jgi:hypothetical protein
VEQGPGSEAVASKEYWNGGGGAGTVVAVATTCEGNKNLLSDSDRKADPEFIVLSISNGSTWNHC